MLHDMIDVWIQGAAAPVGPDLRVGRGSSSAFPNRDAPILPRSSLPAQREIGFHVIREICRWRGGWAQNAARPEVGPIFDRLHFHEPHTSFRPRKRFRSGD